MKKKTPVKSKKPTMTETQKRVLELSEGRAKGDKACVDAIKKIKEALAMDKCSAKAIIEVVHEIAEQAYDEMDDYDDSPCCVDVRQWSSKTIYPSNCYR